MNDLCAEIGYQSINHIGEQLCGDHVDIAMQGDDSTVIVLADGLGSGVKASILSTLTSRIISTMLAAGLSIDECISTIAATLPVCSVRGVAYSTFTVINLIHNHTVRLIQYDNPLVILIRDGKPVEYPTMEQNIAGKRIFRSEIRLQEGDLFIAMSDGCPHAGIGNVFNFGWKRSDIAEFMSGMSLAGYTAKVLCTMLLDECNKLYGGKPGDDATAVLVKIRRREPMNILFGPPSERDDCRRMMRLFFAKEGKHIICGGTTASIAADYLHKSLKTNLQFIKGSNVPPTAELEGVDLVTEGVVTMSRVLDYAHDYLQDNSDYEKWNFGQDAASKICRLLFEEATDVNFYVGRAMNPAHQNPELPINFNIKMNIVKDLSDCLEKMGKRIKVSYF
ncbi:MAG: SpoIIE family protein phosphatase [Eubacterium sp.]|nr:SpoIIE family protein phosphatase [Eubacterium sp.]